MSDGLPNETATAPLPQAPNGNGSPVSTSRGTTVLPAHRPGWQTTEFWVSGLTLLYIVAGSLEGLPPKYAAIAASVASSAYAISRAITKLGTSQP